MSPPKGRRRPNKRTPPPQPSGSSGLVAAFLVIVFVFTAATIGAFIKAPDIVPDLNHAPQSPPAESHESAVKQFAINVQDMDSTDEFPVHASQDLEEIDHPGVKFAVKPDAKLPKTMMVPKFWDTSSFGEGGLRAKLGNDGERLMTPEEAAMVGSHITVNGTTLETIYIGIASYRDYECALTIESIYARAKHPERIRVAAISQRDFSVDPSFCGPPEPCHEHPEQFYCKYQKNIDIFDTEARLSVGPVFARHLGHRMYRGEYYAMQVDSHVRFVEDWDIDLLLQWSQAKNEMAVLSTYLSDLNGSIDPITHKSKHLSRPIMCQSDYEGAGQKRHLRHGQQPEGKPGIHDQPTLHPFWAAGFSFARGHFVVQIPYDQHLPMVFQGEEISIGLRGWSYGYDYYTAERSVCFHMYAVKENKEKRSKIPLFWENSKRYLGADKKAMMRLNGIIGMGDPADEWIDVELHKYGLGKVRTTQKFFDTFGIHTQNKTVETGLCTFVGKPLMRRFHPLLRKNGMGLDYDLTDFKFTADWRKNLTKPALYESFP